MYICMQKQSSSQRQQAHDVAIQLKNRILPLPRSSNKLGICLQPLNLKYIRFQCPNSSRFNEFLSLLISSFLALSSGSGISKYGMVDQPISHPQIVMAHGFQFSGASFFSFFFSSPPYQPSLELGSAGCCQANQHPELAACKREISCAPRLLAL